MPPPACGPTSPAPPPHAPWPPSTTSTWVRRTDGAPFVVCGMGVPPAKLHEKHSPDGALSAELSPAVEHRRGRRCANQGVRPTGFSTLSTVTVNPDQGDRPQTPMVCPAPLPLAPLLS